MWRAVRGLGWFLIGIAVLSIAAYGAGVVFADSRTSFAEDWSSAEALGLMAGVIGALLLIASSRADRASLRLPPAWLSIGIFALAVGAGYATTLSDRAVYVTPLLAVVAASALAAAIYRLTTYWARDRQVGKGLLFPSFLWSMLAAPIGAAVLQLALAAAIIGAIVAGLYVSDSSLATGSEVREIFDGLGESTSADVPELYSTPTVALALFTLLAVVAPFTEEFLKGLGVLVTFRRRASFSERDVFVAGIGAGLGFAAVEALGYSLLDVDFWPTMMLLRAPVVLIHVAATLLFARGWYLQQSRGGFSLGWGYGLAVLLHGVWNGLFVAALVLASAIDDPSNPDAFASALLLAVVAGLGATWLVSIGIVVAGARNAAKQQPPEASTSVSGEIDVSARTQGSPLRSFKPYHVQRSS